ncbi:MAG TPA: histidinol-phosphate transaminase [Chthoniobacterales bacterium]|nr:histidinol-phosphate transaminase [Chthoniobacterales bacterium]
MRSLWELANPQLKHLKVYQPGKPIEETARELNVEPQSIIKLASNENPLGPSPSAVSAMRAALNQAELYPDGSAFYLTKDLAARLGVAPENVVIGNGSNEIIEFAAHAFLGSGDNVVVSQYAFIAYKIIATLFNAETIEVASSGYQQDLDKLLDAITPKTRLVFVPNPNNPTGTLVAQRDIDRFMERVPDHVITVFDEAYYELLDDPPDVLQFVRQNRNVLVLRTFSKIHGLAGLRVGYGIAAPAMIEILHKTREPFNVNSIGQVGALAALGDQSHQRKTRETVAAGRTYLANEFARLKLEFVPGAANFLMVKVGDGPGIFQEMLRRKVIVRPLVGYGLKEWLRISVGTMEQNEKCISALSESLTESRRR